MYVAVQNVCPDEGYLPEFDTFLVFGVVLLRGSGIDVLADHDWKEHRGQSEGLITRL